MINRFTLNNHLIKSKVNKFCCFYSTRTSDNLDHFFQKPKPKIKLDNSNNNNDNNNKNIISNSSSISSSIPTLTKSNTTINNNEIIIKDKYIELFNEINNKINNKKDLENFKLILSKSNKTLLELILKSKSTEITKIYQKSLALIIQYSTINQNQNNQLIDSIIKDLLHIVNDNHSYGINLYSYDESEDFDNDDVHKISKIFSELIFYNEVNQIVNNQFYDNQLELESTSTSTSTSTLLVEDQNIIYKIIAKCLREEFKRLPFNNIKEQAVINLIMLFLQMEMDKYHLALKWLSIGVQDNISKKLLYKCFYLHHINKSNKNKFKKDEQLLHYWIEAYSSLKLSYNSNINNGGGENEISNESDEYIKENERFLKNSNYQYISEILDILNDNSGGSSSININKNNSNNISNYFDEELELLITSIIYDQEQQQQQQQQDNNNNNDNDKLIKINNLKEYLNNYFNYQIIPNGKQLIIASELIKSNSMIDHTFWYNNYLPEYIKPMLHYYPDNFIIVKDIENGLRIFINKQGFTSEEKMKQTQNNNEILVFIIFGLVKLKNYHLANLVLDQLVYNLYCKPLLIQNIKSNSIKKHLSSNNISKYFKQIDPLLIKDFYENCYLSTSNSVTSLYSVISLLKDSNQQYSSIPSSLKYHLPLEIANLALLSYIKENKIQDALKLFELLPRKDAQCLRYGLLIYSRLYPIPPIENFLKWESIRYHYNLNSINQELLKDSIIILLFQTGNQNLIEMLYNKGAFKVSRLSQESLLTILKSFELSGKHQMIKPILNQYPSLKRYNASLLHFLYHININYLNDDQLNLFIQNYKDTMINDLSNYNNNNQNDINNNNNNQNDINNNNNQNTNNNNNNQLDDDILAFINLLYDQSLITKAQQSHNKLIEKINNK